MTDKIYIFNGKGQLTKRRCANCLEFKPISAFQRAKGRTFGIHCYCKVCRGERENPQRATYQKARIRELRLRAYQIVSRREVPVCVMSKLWSCCNDSKNGLFLSLDHIASDGANHRREIHASASSTLYRWVINNPEEAQRRFQILCMNAQTMKRRIKGEHGGKGYKPPGGGS